MSKKLKTEHAPQSTQDELQKPKLKWKELVFENGPKHVIPVGRVFQADLPNQTDNNRDTDSIKWLGERIWPLQQDNNEVIGEGKPKICSCQKPGSVECVRLHVTEKSNRLKTELGPAYEKWKFDQMGENLRSEWSQRDEKRFEELMKRNRSADESLVDSSWKSFRTKDMKSLSNYNLNVYIPKNISQLTRSGCTEVETDDEVPSSSQKLEPDNDSKKTGSRAEAKNDKASKVQKNGAKSETAEDERSQSEKKKSAKKKYLCSPR